MRDNNTFNYIFNYIPPIGDDIERKNVGGENIEDNSTFSFSISFFQTPSFLVGDLGLGFCHPQFKIWNFDIPTNSSRLFPQSHLTSPGVIS